MENDELNQAKKDEPQIPVNLEKYLKDNLSFFKFIGEVANMYSTGFVKTGLNMINPSSFEFEKENASNDPINQ